VIEVNVSGLCYCVLKLIQKCYSFWQQCSESAYGNAIHLSLEPNVYAYCSSDVGLTVQT